MYRVALTAVLTLCFGLPTFAWDDAGHKITTYIAWQQMKPEVRERVIKILRLAPEDSQLATFYMQYGTRSDDATILETSNSLYAAYRLKRVYYSAFSPIPDAAAGLPLAAPPLLRGPDRNSWRG